MTHGVPGFFTVDGFYKVLLPELPAATRQVANESWVLGMSAEIDPASPQVLTLQRDVIALYTDDYAKQWDTLLEDLDVAPMHNLQEALQELYMLASPQSPLRDLLAAMTRQLSLTQPPPPPVGAAQGAANATANRSVAQPTLPRRPCKACSRNQRAIARTPGEGGREALCRADKFCRQGSRCANRQRTEAAVRSSSAAC